MRVVVVREYTDKYTGEGHVIGEKLDMTEERFAEIQDKGMFVVDISDEVVQQETPAVSAEHSGAQSYRLQPERRGYGRRAGNSEGSCRTGQKHRFLPGRCIH